MSSTFDETYWQAHYSAHGGGSGHDPNPHLVAAAEPLPPGTALDAGCGEGANAAWLAARGWHLTAVDIAANALRGAQEYAESLGSDVAGRIEWAALDLTRWTPPERHFDLVYSLYVHVAGANSALFRRLAAAVAPGGTLLIVGHYPSDEHTHEPAAGSFVTPDEIADVLDPACWDIAIAEAARWSTAHSSGETVLHDAVVRARRAG